MKYLHDFSTFENTIELNRAIYLHIRNHTHELTETDRTTLKTLARYAVKYAGALHMKAATLAELIGKSEKTARRAINKLVKLEIIEKYATTRKVNGGKGANIIVITPAFESLSSSNDQSTVTNRGDAEKSTESNDEQANSSSEPSDSFKHLQSTINIDTHTLPANALRSALPHAIYTVMSPFVNAEEMYRYYGLLLKAKRKIAPDTLIENDADPYVEAFNATMFKVKRGQVRKVERYLYVAFERAAAEVNRRARMSDRDELLAFNWLDESA